MKLLTRTVLEKLPPLGAQKDVADPIAHVKFFIPSIMPNAGWTWYATEGSPDGEDFLFFGYVIGFESEWEYFSLSELQNIRDKLSLPVERDRFFRPTAVSKLT